MPDVNSLIGSKLEFGGLLSNLPDIATMSTFAGQTWTEVKGTVTVGAPNVTQNSGSTTFINGGFERAYKTTIVGGDFNFTAVPMLLDPGQKAIFDAARNQCGNYAMRLTYGANCLPTATVTISVATPGVVTWNAHGLLAGQPVVFITTGVLPTGLTAGTTYYVHATGLTANTFSVSATVGGSAIATTAAGSGVHTATAPTVGGQVMFGALVMPESLPQGEATASNIWTFNFRTNTQLVYTGISA